MRLTRASDYAVRILINLAENAETTRATRESLIENTGVPAAFLNKLVQRLVRAELIAARPGVRGGCWLATPAETISVLRVIESIDGPLELNKCIGGPEVCPRAGYCSFRRLLNQVQDEMVRILSSTTVADLVRDGQTSLPCVPTDPCCCEFRPRV